MRRFFSASADSSIYEEFFWRNAGDDSILEVGKSTDAVSSIRSLIEFNTTAISSSMCTGIIPPSASFDLRLFVARGSDLAKRQPLNFLLVSRSWVEGTGFYYENLNVPFTSSRNPTGGFFTVDGITWNNATSGSLWTNPGGDYMTSASMSLYFPTTIGILSASIPDPVADVVLDITPFVQTWVSGSMTTFQFNDLLELEPVQIPFGNNGLLIKYPDGDEADPSNNGVIDFFSRQTHTIYQPQLIAKWNDQTFITGSLSGSSQTNFVVVASNVLPKYKIGELIRIDLSVRDRYPLKQFDTLFTAYSGEQFVPQTSYFSIVDAQSNSVIIPFDNFSLVSCDGTASYVSFYIEGMYPGRFYKLLIKTISGPYQEIYDMGQLFTVEAV